MGRPATKDPTPEQIAEMAAAIRAENERRQYRDRGQYTDPETIRIPRVCKILVE